MFFHLLKIYLKNLYAPGVFLEGFKKGVKSVIKNIFLLLLILYGVTVFYGMMFMMASGSYNTLNATGKIGLMPSVSLVIASVAILFFGFTSVASNYYGGAGDEQFFAMPLSHRDIFRAKFTVSFITDASFGIIIFAMFTCVYAFHQGLLKNPLFYVGLIASFSAFSVAILLVIYLIFILILLALPVLRKKSFLTGVSTVLLMAFVICLSYTMGYYGGSSFEAASSSSLSEVTLPLALKVAYFVEGKALFTYFSSAVDGKILPIIILLALTAALVLLVLPLLSSLYVKTLSGFSDVKSKKLSTDKAAKLISTESKSRSAFNALLFRDIRTVFREPVFFANGPLLCFLLPFIMIISFSVPFIFAGDISLAEFVASVRTDFFALSGEEVSKIYYYVSLGLSSFLLFAGISSNMAATAFSREGKSLSNLKAMPVTFDTLLKVKFYHALIYVIFEEVIFLVILIAVNFIFGAMVPWQDAFRYMLAVCVLSLCASIPLIFLDLLLDMANPKLTWENPAAAFKQNFNSMIAMLFSFVVIAIFIGLGILLPKKQGSLLVISVIFIIIGAPLGSWYFRYGTKRLKVM